VQEILDSENRIDILVNDAGVDFIRSATEMTLAEWDRVQHVNLRAPWLLSRAVFPHMVERGGARSSTSPRPLPRRAGPTRPPTPPPSTASWA
jgi:NAD(P)-dependent dehydrogenase (short-subunit alcohol dehydrogenase family)